MELRKLSNFSLRSLVAFIITPFMEFVGKCLVLALRIATFMWDWVSARKRTQRISGTSVTITKNGQKIYTRKLSEEEQKYGVIIPENAFDVLSLGKQLSNNGRCVGYRPKKDQPYVWLTYQEVIDRAQNFGAGLLTLGAVPNSEYLVGIFAKTCVEWTVADYGCIAYGLVTAPLYDALGTEACLELINFHDIEIVVCGGEDQVKTLLPNGHSPARLRVLVTIEKLNDSRIAEIESLGVKVLTMQDVENLGKLNPRPLSLGPTDSVVSLIFTSGTTGSPKGAMLTHSSFLLALKTFMQAVYPTKLNNQDVIIGYLPLAHIMERLWERAIHLNGGRVGYLTGDIKNLMKDSQELKPTCFAFVPRILSRLHDQILADMNRNFASRILGKVALNRKFQQLQNGKFHRDTLWDQLVFRKYQDMLGGNVRLGITGSAAVDGPTLNFIRTVFSCYVFEFYGQTEAGGPATCTRYGDFSIDHVGEPFNGVEIKLEDVPEMSYFSKDSRGEICTRASFQMTGYYRMPEKTKETIDEELWIHSGDIGTWTPEGMLKVIDRKKHIFKLSQGEYIAPERIESIFGRSDLITNIFIDGDSLYPFPIALIYPNVEKLPPTLPESTITQKLTVELIRLAAEARMKSYEIPKRILILKEPFTVENGCLTQTMKARREAIRTLYRNDIRKLYRTA